MTVPSSVVTAIPSDYPALARFLADFPDVEGKEDFWLSRFRLWWDENPAFRPESPRGWMLRRRGDLAGFLANVPSRMLVGGRPATVFSVSTWMVHAEVRDHSLDLLFRQLDACKRTLLFDTTPTEHVAGVLENLGFQRLPWGEDKESVVLLRPDACLRARFPRAGSLPGAAALGGWLLGSVQSSRGARIETDPDLRVEEVLDAGAPFDKLWERTRSIHPVTNVRSSDVLRWHCAADRHIKKRLYACFSGEDAAGFVVMKPNHRRGLRVLECVDWWEDPSRPHVFETLLAAVRRLAASDLFDLLTFGHFSRPFGERLRAAGLFETEVPARRNLCLRGPECQADLDPRTSYFTALQGDYGTSP